MSDSVSIDPLNFGVALLPNGVRVDLHANPVELQVACRGPDGLVLEFGGFGLKVALGLPNVAAAHLADLLAGQPSSRKADRTACQGRAV